MPRSPRSKHTLEEVEVAQREVPSGGIPLKSALRPQDLPDEADLPVRRQKAGAEERAPLRAGRQRDERIRLDLGGAPPEKRHTLRVRVGWAHQIGEEAARHALLHGVP